jgi:hypothetical protein
VRAQGETSVISREVPHAARFHQVRQPRLRRWVDRGFAFLGSATGEAPHPLAIGLTNQKKAPLPIEDGTERAEVNFNAPAWQSSPIGQFIAAD